jgi:hypothetical protein
VRHQWPAAAPTRDFPLQRPNRPIDERSWPSGSPAIEHLGHSGEHRIADDGLMAAEPRAITISQHPDVDWIP